ncbi:hypothetical protein FRC03_001633 [Tulasnella sp. 419]|nr:hypothetical protein FRC03_001633 [Tulasnella sp. 419]
MSGTAQRSTFPSPQDAENSVAHLNLSGKVSCSERTAGGGFSDVWKGTMGDDHEIQVVAIKKLRIAAPGEPKSKERLMKRLFREVNAWRRLSHPNVVPLLGFSFDLDGLPSFISPWYSNGNIVTYLRSNPSKDRLPLIIDVSRGLCYLHSLPLVHGDIKGENVLVDEQGSASLCDFGTSSFIDDAQRITGLTTSNANVGGTIRFFSPELLEDKPKTSASDIWAFGCLVLQILIGEAPYSRVHISAAILSEILRGNPPYPTELVKSLFDSNEAVSDFLVKCWDVDPSRRPKAEKLLNLLSASSTDNAEATSDGGMQGVITSIPLPTLGSEEMELMNLDTAFFYGSLMDPLILKKVLENDGSHLMISLGILKDYVRHRVTDTNFPAIISSIQSRHKFDGLPPRIDTVPGVIVRGLTPDDQRRISQYNGWDYKFRMLMVEQLEEFQPFCESEIDPIGVIAAHPPEYWSLGALEKSLGTIPAICAVWHKDLDPGLWRYDEMWPGYKSG